MRKYLLIGVSAFVLGAGTMAYISPIAQANNAPKAQTYKLLELFGDVLGTVEDQYVTEVDDKKLIEAALDGMLTSLDPHSGYLAPDAFEDMQDTTRGEYGGLGLEVTSEEGVVKVISPMDGTPASRAGIQAGDYITAVNGQSVLGLTVNEAVKQMRGTAGEAVTLTIAREKTDPFDVKLVREVIKPKAAIARMEGDYGYVRLPGFNEKATDALASSVSELKSKNPKMKGLILDLRNNPGGLLDQAVGVADVFLDGGEVVSQRGRDPRNIQRYNARGGDMLNGLPMVVLINQGSASAAEIVAGALQDRKRAEVVGLTSFGKGSVQTVIPLRGGADGALKLTTARYFTPSGRSIQKTGIAPDLEVAQTRDQAQDIANRVWFSEASFKNALNADEGKSRVGAHTPAEAPPTGFDDKKGDFQLQRAIAVLQAGGVAKTPKLPKPAAKVAEVTAKAAAAAGGKTPVTEVK
ncbi:S41 family peptidase [Caulobacter vibrioides]|uniref:Carboxyl-terminal protease n=2 Tax=Caulobacter vibrioides TaxID=155892 RepID=Q9A2X1_CAUVC|nr:S41 family peptidase [Caulobacter vibrioides]YP_002518921.1 S41 family peptidase [Caulobacter vibrioides NA1000]QBQ57391.1 S41 family peptidase [synthetic Caulobacter sp. 'ethensis']AAK25397.1 carboxyl-terminal protease [Caulobacter vibrioides CB15]ACL97013.1 S41 family peptidase [Caulobacter vibrioides NA1000]ATC26311.1 S41 family peptidase [Caulobacter vibrioides]ATC30259.1 S41 family peptidase [Caulobacter vibrioides]